MGSCRLRIKKSAAQEIEKLTHTDSIRIIQAIEKLAQNPRPVGSQKLSGQEKFRIRVGNYRVLYEIIDHELIIFIVKVAH
ncbi:type II toxin-antitoxin system RelE/ParE family toxin [Opitutales bacterium]|nr:type II toxin-antitoxin system RelE/ParE family toxin [Opitutales bacterium]MDA8990539.1 type II toxin-antitoxin system RelE/ParE family toxin [Opitutales bacterium]